MDMAAGRARRRFIAVTSPVAEWFASKVTLAVAGITLSPNQVEKGFAYSKEKGIDNVEYKVLSQGVSGGWRCRHWDVVGVVGIHEGQSQV